MLADVLDALWGGDETRIVVTTDLSHYHDDATAKAIDRDDRRRVVARTAQLATGPGLRRRRRARPARGRPPP